MSGCAHMQRYEYCASCDARGAAGAFLVVDGTPIWYYPSMNGGVRFAGLVGGSEIFVLGSTPCVRLRDMEPAYGEWKAGGRATTHRTSVPAAAVHCVKSRQPEGTIPHDWDKDIAVCLVCGRHREDEGIRGCNP